TERVNDLVAQSGWNCESSTVNQCARGSRDQGSSVANRAAYLREQRVASNRCRRYRILTTGSTGCSHEVGECKHVVSVVLRIFHWVKRGWERNVDYTFSGAGRVFVGSGVSCV